MNRSRHCDVTIKTTVWKRVSDFLSSALFKVNESVEVLVENVNDNPPNFAQNHFVLEVNEVSADVSQQVWKVHLLEYLYSLMMISMYLYCCVSLSSLQSTPPLD